MTKTRENVRGGWYLRDSKRNIVGTDWGQVSFFGISLQAVGVIRAVKDGSVFCTLIIAP